MKTIIEQMCLDAETIKEKMKEIVNTNLYNSDLISLLYSFIETKESFFFGNLAYQHYIAFNGANFKEIEMLAAGIELLILSFDILDDHEDEDNGSALWMKIDRSVSLNASTTLYTISIQFINSLCTVSDFSRLALNYAIEAMQGQHDDLKNSAGTEEECLAMIKHKSGSLIAMPCVLGTMLACGEYNKTVENYSYWLGIVKQIENDYYGLFNIECSDINKNRNNLVLLYLKRKFNPMSVSILNIMNSKREYQLLLSDINLFKQKLWEAGVTQYVSIMIRLYEDKIMTELNKLNIKLEFFNYKSLNEGAPL
ncbi:MULTISPECIES: polyprenyl synthetase family protein [Bacillus]|nr:MULTISPECIES: polyprenyl synthetase family protein [Bacillus]MCG0590330.1 polyprenyl synthetase family protein [Bacillus velezensis]MEA1005975.1 polyprenyl synthetase family protein [Bacillus velezensis]USQ52935.1 polyprenyl synthetase family protein [Bacillus velezensis]UUY37618.1 polyprenyl synthetase family protein [Bacillus velezensis]UWD96578.1 polyprenyl synthetase family protein [Bacillus velezensis]